MHNSCLKYQKSTTFQMPALHFVLKGDTLLLICIYKSHLIIYVGSRSDQYIYYIN